MKRLTFLVSLFGFPLLGQKRAATVSATCDDCITVEPIDLTPRHVMQGREIHWFSGKALNNQCPVCGTMAAAWKPKPDHDVVCATSILNWGPFDPPTERHIACERCNTVFRQKVQPE